MLGIPLAPALLSSLQKTLLQTSCNSSEASLSCHKNWRMFSALQPDAWWCLIFVATDCYSIIQYFICCPCWFSLILMYVCHSCCFALAVLFLMLIYIESFCSYCCDLAAVIVPLWCSWFLCSQKWGLDWSPWGMYMTGAKIISMNLQTPKGPKQLQ